MTTRFILPNKQPPYSKGVLHDNKYTLEVSGHVGFDPATGKLAQGIEQQTEKTLDAIKKVLAEVGWGFENITKVRIYLLDMKDYSVVNQIYARYFNGEFPSRVAVAVKQLPMDALIEIECTATGSSVKQS
ncbi:MAG: RidA family protein [Nanoarchaeota archaeon]|nr:RidA family protein [Nanoarchaeota archaeon]